MITYSNILNYTIEHTYELIIELLTPGALPTYSMSFGVTIDGVVMPSGDIPALFYEYSEDGITWNSPIQLGDVTSPQDVTDASEHGDFYIRISGEFDGDTIYSNVIHYVADPTTVYSYIVACQEYTWSVTGETYYDSDEYALTIGSVTYVLYLTICPGTEDTNNTDVITIGGDIYTWYINGQTYTASGNFSYNFVDCNGFSCTYYLELTLLGDITGTQILAYRSTATNEASVCGASLTTNCKILAQDGTGAIIQVGDFLLTTSGAGINGNNEWFKIQRAIADIDEPIYGCQVSYDGQIIAVVTC